MTDTPNTVADLLAAGNTPPNGGLGVRPDGPGRLAFTMDDGNGNTLAGGLTWVEAVEFAHDILIRAFAAAQGRRRRRHHHENDTGPRPPSITEWIEQRRRHTTGACDCDHDQGD